MSPQLLRKISCFQFSSSLNTNLIHPHFWHARKVLISVSPRPPLTVLVKILFFAILRLPDTNCSIGLDILSVWESIKSSTDPKYVVYLGVEH